MDIASYITKAAIERGIDPGTALKVWASEGKGAWQSNYRKGSTREPSYGDFQLLVGGPGTGYPAGMGNDFIKKTGLDPRDEKNRFPMIDFALDRAKEGGWGPWYGAKKVGITGMMGIGNPQGSRAGNSAGVTGAVNMGAGKPSMNDNSLLSNVFTSGGDKGGLLGLIKNPQTRDMLLALGAGIASGSTEGWGSGIGKGLALAGVARQNNQESALSQQLLALKMAEAGVPGAKSALGIPESQFGIDDVKDRAGVEGGLRKEYSSLSGDFIKVRDSYAKIQAASADPSPAGDMAMIFNYMRLLDPGSTVREGEYATAQNAAAVPDRVRNMYNMVVEGTKLTPSQRSDFTKQAKGLFSAQERQQKKLEKQYRGIAERLKVDFNNITPDFSIEESPAIPGEGAPQTSTAIKGDLGAPALPPGVTEEDILFTMQKHGLTREQVLERLQNAP